MYLGGWSSGGYGEIYESGKNRSAHVVSYEIHNGPVPPNKMVLHTCDNPWCVNPAHLFLGTQRENVQDMIAKVRSTIGSFVGEKNGQATLTEVDVLEIKSLLEDGLAQREIAAAYGIDQSTVSNIKTGKRWSYLNG
jgi:HNH endonuclease